MHLLQDYPWKGDLKQLRHVVNHLILMSTPKEGDSKIIEAIGTDKLPPEIVTGNSFLTQWQQKTKDIVVLPLKEAREIFEREYLMAQVHRFAGNISKTAKFVGMERSALHKKLRILGIHEPKTGRL
jgi:two-component system nitrogen regulation response regulator NtrX